MDEKLPHGSLPQDREVSGNGLVEALREIDYLLMFQEDYRTFHQGPRQPAVEPCLLGL